MAAVWAFEAIGTRWEIETPSPLDRSSRAAVEAVIDRFDIEWSRFRPDSTVSRLSAGGTAPAPPDAEAMFALLAEASDATDGAVNPLVGASLDALGYDPSYSLRAGDAVAAPADWRARLRWDAATLTLRGPGIIDVGALGKGRLVDLVLDAVLESSHPEPALSSAEEYCPDSDASAESGPQPGISPLPSRGGPDVVVDASGDLAVRGAPVRIGLEHPFDATRAIGVWEIRDQALCASAANRRTWPGLGGESLHHVLDARTGAPVRTIVATWAVADDAMRADAAATALFFDGGDALCHGWGVPWVRMLSDGRVEYSPGCDAELFARGASVDA